VNSTATDTQRELKRCAVSAVWFTAQYIQIYDATDRAWIPFDLWREQGQVLLALLKYQLIVVLKARQLGMTWLMLAYALWLMLYRPAAVVLLFSRRDDEARHLLERLKGMYLALPDWMQDVARQNRQGPRLVTDNEHVLEFGNGSVARAFPPNAGDSYTASFVLVDEADLVPDLGKLMASVKPTIDGGGTMALVSRADKSKPNSEFKNVYRAAKAKLNSWLPVFLPWSVRPGRDAAWYEAQKTDSLTRTGGLDYLWEQYPETDDQALAPNQKDKRLPLPWLLQCYQSSAPLSLDQLPGEAPLIPGLEIYALPGFRRTYVIGADTAEGNPHSDDSAASVLDKDTGEEVATLAGRYEPATFASYLDELSRFYNGASILVERNNHGHAVLLWLREHSRARRLRGYDGRDGWLTNARGKAQLYADVARDLRDHGLLLHSAGSYSQLAGIEGSTLNAPDGEQDDRAIAFALAAEARGADERLRATYGEAPAGFGQPR
jgi:hypothetical protein